MKHLFGSKLKSFMMLSFALLVQTVLMAQEGGEAAGTSTVSVTRTETTSSNWYASPWVWVIGVAVFILLLVALLRGNSDRTRTVAGRTDRVTVTKTTGTDIA